MCEAMGRGLNSARLRRQKRRLRPRVQKPRQQPEVSHQKAPTPPPHSQGSAPPVWLGNFSLLLLFLFSLRLRILLSACFLPASLLLSCLSQTTSDSLGLSLHLGLSASVPISSIPLSLTLYLGFHSSCSRRTMSFARAWQPEELSGRPGLWSWKGTWRP